MIVPEHAVARLAAHVRATGRAGRLLARVAGEGRARELAGPPRPQSLARVFPCRHEGAPTSDWNADALLQVRRCDFAGHPFDRCRRGGSRCGRDGIESCTTCEHHAIAWPPADGFTRHLLYYVYPVAGNGVWQCNVDQLLERIDLFNGRRVCAVARQEGQVRPRPEGKQRPRHHVDPPGLVRERLAGRGFDFIELANDQHLGEVAAFGPLWERVAGDTGPGDVTFYYHAKGTTRPVNAGVSVHPWASLLYAANLDYWPVVADLLARFPVVGAMKTLGKAAAYSGGWHYSGTAYWFKNRETFARDWRRIDRVWGGVEGWPGVQFSAEEAGCVFWEEAIRPRVTGYDMPRLQMVLGEFTRWSEANAQHRRPGASTRPWFDHHGYP